MLGQRCVKPGEEIRLVRENLAFAVRLWKAAAAGKLPSAPLVNPGTDYRQFNQRSGSPVLPEGEQIAELTRGAANQMRGAFALSALQSQRSMAEAFPGEPIEEEWPELRAARCSLYLIGLAVQRSALRPVWECPPSYRKLFHIRRFGFTLNAAALEGRQLSWDDFGGLERYLSLLGYCSASADAVVERGISSRTLPAQYQSQITGFGGVIGAPVGGAGDAEPAAPPPGYSGEQPDRSPAPAEPPYASAVPHAIAANGADDWTKAGTSAGGNDASEWRRQNRHTAPAGAVSLAANPPPASGLIRRFIAERCETGEGLRTLAGELYKGFLGWCAESGCPPVSQRAFGMRLTGLGLTRKRRGHGKHWWEGIRLAGIRQRQEEDVPAR